MKSLVGWKPIFDRIILAQFKTRPHNLKFIQIYAPTEQAFPDEKETFYMQIDRTCRDVNVCDIKILSGDLNAKVSSDNKDYVKVMGNQGIEKTKEIGELLPDLCMSYLDIGDILL